MNIPWVPARAAPNDEPGGTTGLFSKVRYRFVIDVASLRH